MAKIDWTKHRYQQDVKTQSQLDWNSHQYEREVRLATLNFGKHKGKKINQVPVDYLRWVIKTFKANQYNHQQLKLIRQHIASSEKRTKVENPETSVQDAQKNN
jgi:uncharacterized protein (DUF3820 family)